jgi:hypothetical protein
MRSSVAFALICIFTSLANAEGLIVSGGDLLNKGRKLSVEETNAIVLVDSDVEQTGSSKGDLRRWRNNADGKFVASRVASTGGRMVSGSGEWKRSDSGQYCVQIDWQPRGGAVDQEKWCRTLWSYDGAVFLAPYDLTVNRDRGYGQVRFTNRK